MTPVLRACLVLALGGLAIAAAPRTPPAAPAVPAREPLLTAPASLPASMLGQAVSAKVRVRAHVAPSGLVDSTRATSTDPRLRESAEAAVRWWVFPPAERAAWLTVDVPIEAAADASGLHPDVLALARDAEARGDLPTALASWVGALRRAGTSPVVNNPWSLREHAIAVARRMPAPPATGNSVFAIARGARTEQLRTVARANHEQLVVRLDEALTAAPWWDEPWLWRAGSLAGCGRTAEALRSLRAYRLASSDSAGLAFASSLVTRLVAADTVGVCEAVKTWRVKLEPPSR